MPYHYLGVRGNEKGEAWRLLAGQEEEREQVDTEGLS